MQGCVFDQFLPTLYQLYWKGFNSRVEINNYRNISSATRGKYSIPMVAKMHDKQHINQVKYFEQKLLRMFQMGRGAFHKIGLIFRFCNVFCRYIP